MTGPPPARYLTAREVAEQFGVSSETILRWARRGHLPSVHLSNRAIRFRQDELEEWAWERATPERGHVTDPAGRRPATTLIGVTDPE